MSDRTVEDALEIARLAALPPLEYDRQRPDAADRLNCRVTTLDQLILKYRGSNPNSADGQGRPLDVAEPEPWPESVGLAALLDDIVVEIRRYVILPAAEAELIALWVVGAHAFDRFDIFPRLLIAAPEKRCGKGTLLDVLELLVPRPLLASNIRSAALFRSIEAVRPTFLLDEADAYARKDEDLRSVLDAGHCRRGDVIRCTGENNEPREFSTFCPVVLAAIGHLPGTIEDRSIRITLRRLRPDEPIERLRVGRNKTLPRLSRMASRWAADHAADLAAADPVMPPSMINRAADNYLPLLAVADLAGNGWSDRARNAALNLLKDGEDDSLRVLFLADLRDMFDREPSEVLFTREILASLRVDETRPWPEFKNEKPITDRQLASLLKQHGILPKTVRRGEKTEKGYRAESFTDAFARYLKPRTVTASRSAVSAAFAPVPSVTTALSAAPNVTDRTCEKRGILLVVTL